ncbi:MAG: sulfopyruvate decarboxylase subunit alpha [Planctomycetes bacterium]|nr:sulfopyruvate decarboxylase subunit alpha [Planctomycetota bacterium]
MTSGGNAGRTESSAETFLEALLREGFDFFAGVPCSHLGGVLRKIEVDPRYGYVPAVREDAAIGVAAGAYLAGAWPVVFMQNSGLGQSMNALGTLSAMYGLPVLLVVSWRGEGGTDADAPEHVANGRMTQGLLDTLGIERLVLSPERIGEEVREAARLLREGSRPVALLVRKGILE